MDMPIGLQEFRDSLCFMCGQVIGDDMDLPVCGLRDDEIGQKRHKLLRRVPLRRLAQDFARLGIESGIQRQGAMPAVFKSMAFCPTWRQWQHRILPIERLDGGRVDPILAIVHTVLFWAGNVFTSGLILLAPLVLDRKRTVHDLLLGTVVTRA